MADLSLSIKNADLDRVVDALCGIGGYDGEPDDKAARREFARRLLADRLQQMVLEHERREAASQAMASVIVAPVDVD